MPITYLIIGFTSLVSFAAFNNPDIFQKLLAELIPIVYKDLATTA